MDKRNLKNFITKVLLEKVKTIPSVHGKLVKKNISFRGIERECVCEGTIQDANEYAIQNNLSFKFEETSHFGGHYINEWTSYEFQPNPEFYGELMETNMSAREQLSRICGTNDKVLTEVDTENAENLIEFIYTNESFCRDKTNMIFEKITNEIQDKMYDKTQFTRLFEYLVKQACRQKKMENLTETELGYTTKLLSQRFFENKVVTQDSVNEAETKCGKKSFKTGSAFENMQRIVSGHQMFL